MPNSGWQPIETAPQDGTRFAGFRDGFAAPLFVCWWGERDGQPHLFCDANGGHQGARILPTHWIAFPDPEEKEDADDDDTSDPDLRPFGLL